MILEENYPEGKRSEGETFPTRREEWMEPPTGISSLMRSQVLRPDTWNASRSGHRDSERTQKAGPTNTSRIPAQMGHQAGVCQELN